VRHSCIVLAACAAIAAGCTRPPRLAADLIVSRAKVWTGDPRQPEASALAVIGDRIVDVVDTADEIERWRGPSTMVVDAAGRRVVPGFNDAHVRLIDGATQLENISLKDADSPAEFARRIGERAKAQPGEWILGGEWDDRRWTPAQLPTRQLVDDLTNGTPVFVTRFDGRMALANSTVLGRAGIGVRTRNPIGGAIVRDAKGYPTGVLRDAAMNLVTRVLPDVTREQRTRILTRALQYAASLGVTTLQDVRPSPDDISLYADFTYRGGMRARIDTAHRSRNDGETGKPDALGSGWPAAALNPLLTVQAVTTSGALTLAQALTAYTAGSASAELQQSQKGTLARGKLADLVVLSDDIFAIPLDRFKDVRVLTTIVGGRIVHRRNP